MCNILSIVSSGSCACDCYVDPVVVAVGTTAAMGINPRSMAFFTMYASVCVLRCSAGLDFLHAFLPISPFFSSCLSSFLPDDLPPPPRPKFASWRKNVGLRVSSSTCCPKSWRSSDSTLESLISSALSP